MMCCGIFASSLCKIPISFFLHFCSVFFEFILDTTHFSSFVTFTLIDSISTSFPFSNTIEPGGMI